MDLESAKAYVIDFVRRHPGVYESERPMDDVVAEIAAANSSALLFAAL